MQDFFRTVILKTKYIYFKVSLSYKKLCKRLKLYENLQCISQNKIFRRLKYKILYTIIVYINAE